MVRAIVPAFGAVLLAPSAFAHGVAGPRVFVNTLLLDDPAVSDEASLPTFSWPSGRSPNSISTLTTFSPIRLANL